MNVSEHRILLKKYINIIGEMIGVYFIDENKTEFSEEEYLELQEIIKEIDNDYEKI